MIARGTPAPWHGPIDLAQSAEWGATCGPAAIAAVLGKAMCEVKPAILDYRAEGLELSRRLDAVEHRRATP